MTLYPIHLIFAHFTTGNLHIQYVWPVKTHRSLQLNSDSKNDQHTFTPILSEIINIFHKNNVDLILYILSCCKDHV